MLPPLHFPLVSYLVHTPHPFLIRFSESVGIRFYGLAYLLGFITGAWLLHRYYRAGRSPLDFTAISDLMTYLIAGVLLGGRLGYFLLYHPGVLVHEPLAVIRVWEGGMASHGAFVGVFIATWLFTRKHPITLPALGDLVVTLVPAGVFLGRIANYLNGELWGKVTTVPWGVVFAATGGGDDPRHPSQLYEAAAEGLLLLAWMQWRFWRGDIIRRQPGRLLGEFLVGYALVRIFCELFREPDIFPNGEPSLILGLSRGTFYSLFLIVAGVVVIARAGAAGSKRKA